MFEDEDIRLRRNSIFSRAVNQQFRFLNTEYGFDGPITGDGDYPKIRYRKKNVSIKISYGPRSFTMDVGICHNYVSTEYFSLDYIIDASLLPKSTTTKGSFATHDIENIETCVKTMADRTQTYATVYLDADIAAFRNLRHYSRQRSEQLNEFYSYSHDRTLAQEAWREKDLKTVIKVYGTFPGKLKPFEVRRLKYARSKTKSKTSQWLERTLLSFRGSHSENPEGRDE